MKGLNASDNLICCVFVYVSAQVSTMTWSGS